MHAQALLRTVVTRLVQRRNDIDATIRVLEMEFDTDGFDDPSYDVSFAVGTNGSNGSAPGAEADGALGRSRLGGRRGPRASASGSPPADSPARVVDAYFARHPDHHVSAADVMGWAKQHGYETKYDAVYPAMTARVKQGRLARDENKKFYDPAAAAAPADG